MPVDELHREGQWFVCDHVFVFPKSKMKAYVKGAERAERTAPAKSINTRASSLRVPRLLREAATAMLRYKAMYNNQPRWSLREFDIRSQREALAIVQEFQQFASFASHNFGWSWQDPGDYEEWQRHAWKHIDFPSIESMDSSGFFFSEAESARNNTKDLEAVVQAAIRKNPEAVARLDALFPNETEKHQALTGLSPSENHRIPSSEDLALDLVTTIKRKPDSSEADRARRDLGILVSRRAITGAVHVGRLRVPHSNKFVAQVFKMSYALARQIKEVNSFLESYQPSASKRVHLLRPYYPWLGSATVLDLPALATTKPIEAAGHIASHVLKVSPSKIQKIVYH